MMEFNFDLIKYLKPILIMLILFIFKMLIIKDKSKIMNLVKKKITSLIFWYNES